MEPQFVTKPAFTVVGLKIRTTPMNPAIPSLWDQFAPRIDEITNLAEPQVSYGLIDHFAENQLDYMAGCSVLHLDVLPVGMTSWEVPASTYAVFQTTLATIGETFGYIYGVWFPATGVQQAAGLSFERYGESFNPDDPKSAQFDIYIPVVQ